MTDQQREQIAEALRLINADIEKWADGERGHVLQGAHDAAKAALALLAQRVLS